MGAERARKDERASKDGPGAGAWRSHAPALALLALAALASARALELALANRVALRFVDGIAFVPEALAIVASAIAVAAALRGEIGDARRGAPRARPLAPLVLLPSVLVGGWALFLAFAQPFARLRFDLVLGIAAGVLALLCLLERRAGAHLSRAARIAALSAASLALAAIVAEAGLRVIARVRPSPLFARSSDGPARQLERFRCKPGEMRFGFPCNSRGYYDDEFARKQPGKRRIVSIGDSFNLGAVPHAYNLGTVCERALGIPIDAFGVAGAGPPEYLSMLSEEALALDPDLVVIQLFVGNDLSYGNVESGRPHAWLRAWLERGEVLLAVVPKRLARIDAERDAARDPARAPAAPQGEGAKSFPWVDDPKLEEPGLSEPAFLRVETQRALEICRGIPSAFADACRMLLAAREAAGAIPVAVVIVPDEFQVEDELWRAVETRAGTPLERDLPQRLLAAFLERERFSYLDLLPALRETPPLGDGHRHVYHLRDTHFNARGNRVAGEVLAKFLGPLLEQTTAGRSR